MEQHHHDHHHHEISSLNKAFIIGIALNLAFVVAEFAAGFWYNSLGLLSDAGHNLGDVASLVLAMLAFRLAKGHPTCKYTYGYKKSTVLVSLLNAVILLVAVGVIFAESIDKLKNPTPIAGGSVAWVAGVGIVINAFTAWLFLKDKEKDLNVKGAYLHMAADTLVSVGVLISGIVISFTGWYIIDPIIGMVIAVVILISTAHLLHDSLRLSLDGVPTGIDSERIRKEILDADPGIANVHHLHIWAISTTENALTAHIAVRDTEQIPALKHRIKHLLEHTGITHATLEFERPEETCDDPGCNPPC